MAVFDAGVVVIMRVLSASALPPPSKYNENVALSIVSVSVIADVSKRANNLAQV